MKVLVCGGRKYFDKIRVFKVLDYITEFYVGDPITEIVQGGAAGADKLAKEWAIERSIPYKEYEAKWDKHGRAAGPIRNIEMLEDSKPDLVVAFPGKNGTAHMISIAKKAGVRTVISNH